MEVRAVAQIICLAVGTHRQLRTRAGKQDVWSDSGLLVCKRVLCTAGQACISLL